MFDYKNEGKQKMKDAKMWLPGKLNKSLGFDKLCSDVALILINKDYDINASPAEFRDFIQKLAQVKPGTSAEDIASQLISEAEGKFDDSSWTPGAVTAIISARGRSRTTGFGTGRGPNHPLGDRASVSGGSGGKDTGDYGGAQTFNPTEEGSGYPQSIGHEQYGDNRSAAGTSQDRQQTAARYRAPRISVQGEQNPDFVASDSPGLSGNYGTDTRISTQKTLTPVETTLTTKDITNNPALRERFKKQYENFARSGRPAPFVPGWVTGMETKLPTTIEEIAKSYQADEELAQRGHPGYSCDDAHAGSSHDAFEKGLDIQSLRSYSARLESEVRQLRELASNASSAQERDYYQTRALRKEAVASHIRKQYTPSLTK
jgi:hypothetical protein